MRLLLVGLVLVVFGNTAQAQRGRRTYPQYVPQYTPQYRPTPLIEPAPGVIPQNEVADALEEVNAKRATRGLRPFIKDAGLTVAAYECAKYRAKHLMFGHTSNDFNFSKVQCESTGCAAYEDRYGWMSCCMWENYTYAGAAWVRGKDGKRYMHLFVR
jgi:hypothetical protein